LKKKKGFVCKILQLEKSCDGKKSCVGKKKTVWLVKNPAVVQKIPSVGKILLLENVRMGNNPSVGKILWS